MERVYNKLVRDNIPDVILGNEEVPITRVLDDKEYNEVIEACGKDRLEELADLLEVISALAKVEGESLDKVIEIAKDKASKRGSFDKKMFLEKVII